MYLLQETPCRAVEKTVSELQLIGSNNVSVIPRVLHYEPNQTIQITQLMSCVSITINLSNCEGADESAHGQRLLHYW